MWQVKNKTQFELLRIAISGTKSAIIGQVAVLAIVAHQFFYYIPTTSLLSWVGVHLTLYLVRFFIGKRFLSLKNTEENFAKATKVLHIYTYGLFFTSVVWGSAVMFLPLVPTEYHYLLYVIVVGFTFASILSVGTVLPMFFAFSLPMNITVFYYILARHASETFYYDVLVFIVIVMIYTLKASHNYRTIYLTLAEEKLKTQRNLEEITREHKNKTLYLEAIDKIGVAMVVTNSEGVIVDINETSRNVFGDLVGKEFDLFLTKQMEEVQSTISSVEYAHLQSGKRFEVLHQELSVAGQIPNRVYFFNDVTQEYRRQETLQKLAHRFYQKAQIDPLTKVYNREAFFEELKQRLYETDREFSKAAMMFVDMNYFKSINDTYGHKAGDTVLKIVAKRVLTSIRQSDLIGRYAGDEFVVFLKNIDNRDVVQQIAQKILYSLSKPIRIESEGKKIQLHVGVSIGISIYPDDAQDVDSLIINSDRAMYKVKEKRNNDFAFYTDIRGEDAESL